MDNQTQQPEEDDVAVAEPPAKAAEAQPDHTSGHGNSHHNARPIIIKRVKKVVKGHHGGSWKIAYADFVTAMMTFFLLMWLLSMLNKYQREGISEYFKDPKKAVEQQQGQANGDKVMAAEKQKTEQKKKEQETKSAAGKSKEAKELKSSEELKKQFEDAVNKDPKASEFKNMLNFKVTSQGLKVEIHDLQNKAMFSSGKADFEEQAEAILDWLGQTMNQYPNRVMIIGHTDNKPLGGDSDDYTNWELSADRANATRRSMIRHGMEPEKIVRIVGAGDNDQLEDTPDGADPRNRRIEIIILNEEAYRKLQQE